jgi:periplasmic copper chaperone A
MWRYLSLSLLLICVAAALIGCAVESLAASNAFSYACAAGGECGVFLTLTNSNSQPDTLVSARTDVADHAELHTVVMDMKGGMKMQQVADIALPASSSVELKPGGFHVMLFGLNKELKAGDTFPLTLKFDKGGEQTVQVQVRTKN